VVANRQLWCKKSESVLDNQHEFANFPISALPQLLVEPGGDPESAESLGGVG
jgi:hypothetical protein